MTQISTSVQLTTEVVTAIPRALTPWAVWRAPVHLDTFMMGLPAQVKLL